MENWEFLLQKEGDRAWKALKTPKIEIEEGRYRVVVHTSRINTDVEIRISHQTTDEVPPKRRFQKRSRRTNPQGLMVLIPFTYLKAGIWEIICTGDLMSDMLGDTWQKAVQLRILPAAIATQPKAPTAVAANETDVAALPENTSAPVAPTTEDVSIPPETVVAEAPVTESSPSFSNELNRNTPQPQPVVETDEDEVEAVDEVIEFISASSSTEILPEPENTVSEEELEPVAYSDSTEENSPQQQQASVQELTDAEAIKERSLQMAEQILQQILEPVWQDFTPTPPASTENPVSTDPTSDIQAGQAEAENNSSSSQVSPPAENNQPSAPETPSPFVLTLYQNAFVARQGEPLTLNGQVEVAQLPGVSRIEHRYNLNALYKGTLEICLRDPQNSQVLLKLQQPLPNELPPLNFSCTFELPANCATRLILGQLVLYDGTITPVASQPFTITADLQDLLSVIGQTGDTPADAVEPEAQLEPGSETTDEIEAEYFHRPVIELIDTPKNFQPINLQPAPSQPLPPQIYQPTPTNKTSKSPQLPIFLKKEPIPPAETAPIIDESTPEAGESPNQETTPFSEDLFLDIFDEQPVKIEATTKLPLELEPEVLPDTSDIVDLLDLRSESGNAPQLSRELPAVVSEPATQAVNSQFLLLPDAAEFATDAEAETQLLPGEELVKPTSNHPAPVEDAFQGLRLQDRFWSRLNALATDAEFSELLKSELSVFEDSGESEEDIEAPISDDTVPAIDDYTTADTELDSSEYQQLGIDYPSPAIDEQTIDTDISIFDEAIEYQFSEPEAERAEAVIDNQTVYPVEQDTQEADLTTPDVSVTFNDTEQWFPTKQLSGNDEAFPITIEAVAVDWNTQEIVVEDEPELPTPEPPIVVSSSSIVVPPIETVASSQYEDVVVPTPELTIPTGELISGEPLTIWVKLPPYPTPIYVKLWVQDRQSRYLLDGPRSLMDFAANEFDDLETIAHLTVPYGSMEVRFEAIAVDIYTQKESHKVSVDRVVLPPDLPNFSLDEFEY